MRMARRREYVKKHDGTREGIVMRLVYSPANIKRENALLWGIAGLIITAIAGCYFRIAPTSMFGFVPVRDISLLWHVILNAIIWVVSCVLPFALAIFINRKTNVTEFFGRMLYAHWPVMFLMLPGITGDKIQYATFMGGLNNFNLATTMELQPVYSNMMLVIVVVLLLWYLYWSYLAFTKAAGRGGRGIFALFIVAMFLSQMLTDATIEEVYKSVLR